jgi:hypothetical protein
MQNMVMSRKKKADHSSLVVVFQFVNSPAVRAEQLEIPYNTHSTFSGRIIEEERISILSERINKKLLRHRMFFLLLPLAHLIFSGVPCET